MKRITVSLPDEVHEALRARAFESRTSLSEQAAAMLTADLEITIQDPPESKSGVSAARGDPPTSGGGGAKTPDPQPAAGSGKPMDTDEGRRDVLRKLNKGSRS